MFTKQAPATQSGDQNLQIKSVLTKVLLLNILNDEPVIIILETFTTTPVTFLSKTDISMICLKELGHLHTHYKRTQCVWNISERKTKIPVVTIWVIVRHLVAEKFVTVQYMYKIDHQRDSICLYILLL